MNLSKRSPCNLKPVGKSGRDAAERPVLMKAGTSAHNPKRLLVRLKLLPGLCPNVQQGKRSHQAARVNAAFEGTAIYVGKRN